MQQMNPGMGAPNPMMAAQGGKKKLFQTEKDNIEMMRHSFVFENADKEFVRLNSGSA